MINLKCNKCFWLRIRHIWTKNLSLKKKSEGIIQNVVEWPKRWKILILLSCEKDNAICSNMDGHRADHTKWSESDRERQILYDVTYVWNLKIWYKWTYLQNKNRLTDTNLYGYQKGWGGRQIRSLGLIHVHHYI